MTTAQAFIDHVHELQLAAEAGDAFAVRSLAAIALVLQGWRPGDPDPDGGESAINFADYQLKLAA